MYSRNILELRAGERRGGGSIAVDETLEAEDIEIRAPSYPETSSTTGAQREELQEFLVSCLLASVSIETMSRHLGIDADTIRSELRHGIEAWNAGRYRATGGAAHA